jgi:hypothetical protein
MMLWKTRNNYGYFLLFLFIFYINYSISIGEFIFSHLTVPMTQVKTDAIYGQALRQLLIFNLVFLFFLKSDDFFVLIQPYSKHKSSLISLIFLFFLIGIFFFGFNRAQPESFFYTVRISPIYEYARILFLVLFVFSPKSKIFKFIVTLTLFIFSLNEIYYGGRITSIQLIFLFILISKDIQFLIKPSRLFFVFIGGIIFAELIGSFRDLEFYDLDTIVFILSNFYKNLFVFDTATFSFYASATHIAATNSFNIFERLSFFVSFLLDTFFFFESVYSDLTTFIGNNIYVNFGGGLIFSHFYFWFDFLGPIILPAILVIVFNKLQPSKYNLDFYLYLSVIISSPRWYLYSPNSLIFGGLLLPLILYFFILIFLKLSYKFRF